MTQPTNEDFAIAEASLAEIAKLGPKSNKVIKRLTQAILTCRRALKEYTLRAEMHMAAWVDTDEDGRTKLREITEGPQKGQKAIVFKNKPEYDKAMAALNREPAKLEGEMMKPFTFDELFKDAEFKTQPDPEQIARLGPFYSEE